VKKLGEEAKAKGVVVKTIAAQWKELTAESKAPYEAKAATAKAEYDAAIESFKQMGGEIVRKRKADKEDKPKKDKDAPKKPAGGGYAIFLNENREKIRESLPAGSNPIGDVAKAAGAQWKAFSEEEKKPYEDKYAQKMKEYQVAIEEYNAKKAAEEKEEEPSPPPKKAKKAEKSEKTPTPPKPVKKGKDKGAAKAAEVSVDATVLAEASKLGFEAALRNLAGRPDVKDLGKSDQDLLEAIKNSGGLVNPARHALLGA